MAKNRTPRGGKASTDKIAASIEVASSSAPLAGESAGMVALSEDDTGHRILVYMAKDGAQVDLRFEGNTFWASQAQMAEMFGVSQPTISEHLRGIFGDGELPDDPATHRKIRLVRREGSRDVSREIEHYGLNFLIAVGYRVGSKQGTMFRMWATEKLFSILTKGFYIDKERLKNAGSDDALDEFRQTAREIRASSANAYREVRRLCTLTADYDPKSDTARVFYMDMENKLLWAATSMTAPQLIIERCNASSPDCGLTYYAGKRGPRKDDVTIGNNYLAPIEAERKNRATVMWLDYIEEQLDQGKLPTMAAVQQKLEEFIKFNGWPVLRGVGAHSRKAADRHALTELEKYRAIQELLS